MAEIDETGGGRRAGIFATIWTAVYFGVVLLGLLHHEMWRDELQTWLTTANSGSLRELLANMRYDGRPGLWHLMVYVAARFTEQPMAMQLVHLALATGTAWMILRHAPFSRTIRLALCLGYFVLYEYAIISRDYALGVFFAVLFCVRYRDVIRPGIGLGLILVLMALSNPFATLLCLALAGFVALDRLVMRRSPGKRFDGRIGWTLGLALSGAMFALWMIRPPPDAGFFNFAVQTSGFHAAAVGNALSILFAGHLPIPQAQIAGWNTNCFAGLGRNWISLGGVVILVLGVLVLLRNPRALLFYVMATGGFLAYFYQFPVIPYFLRHSGQFFLILVMGLWLARTLEPTAVGAWPSWAVRAGIVLERPFIAWLLAAQVLAGAMAYANDWRHPFSNSHAAAAFLEAAGYGSNAIVGVPDVCVSPFAALLNRPIFYSQRRELGTFVIFDQKTNRKITPDLLLAPCPGLFQKTGRPVIVIVNGKLTKTVDGEIRSIREEALEDGCVLRLLNDFSEPCICGDEHYWIYIYDRQADEAG